MRGSHLSREVRVGVGAHIPFMTGEVWEEGGGERRTDLIDVKGDTSEVESDDVGKRKRVVGCVREEMRAKG